MTVVDPACGSGHFVVAAARRIGTALAEVRTGDTEPSPAAVRAATADVIERCVYGVDLNDLAIEITKVALWLEAFDAGRPFPFLDAHFRIGNALLGTTPALLKHNIPDTAFAVLGDDDRDWTAKLKARNKAERQADVDQLTLDFGRETLNVETIQFHKAAQEADTGTTADLAKLRARADAWRKLETDPDLIAAKLVADAWCAAFVQPKTKARTRPVRASPTPHCGPSPRTRKLYRTALSNSSGTWPASTASSTGTWSFPASSPLARTARTIPTTGWSGGFSCVIGNPPWERVKIQDKEFFGNLGRTDIENAATAAIRKKMIDELADGDPHFTARTRLRCGNRTPRRIYSSKAAAIP